MTPSGTRPQPRRRILVVDDDPTVRDLMARIIETEGYDTDTAADGHEALDKLPAGYDLVITDRMLPNIDGHELTRRIRGNSETCDIPVIMATETGTTEERIRAVEAGATDFISKPVTVIELQVRIRTQMKLRIALDALKETSADDDTIEKAVVERTRDLKKTIADLATSEREAREAHLATIHRLAAAAEFKDQETGAHNSRIGETCGLLALWLGLSAEDCDLVENAGPMHDIGKIGVPESILFKPGKLNESEWAIMRQHPEIGANMLSGSRSKYIVAGEVVAMTHHEKWNGTGYPKGLKGEAIPMFGRICMVADVYDALTSKRPYKAAYSISNSLEIMHESRGTYFDPRVFDAFMDNHKRVEEIRFGSSPSPDLPF